jgi:hypothetical protein
MVTSPVADFSDSVPFEPDTLSSEEGDVSPRGLRILEKRLMEKEGTTKLKQRF